MFQAITIVHPSLDAIALSSGARVSSQNRKPPSLFPIENLTKEYKSHNTPRSGAVSGMSAKQPQPDGVRALFEL